MSCETSGDGEIVGLELEQNSSYDLNNYPSEEDLMAMNAATDAASGIPAAAEQPLDTEEQIALAAEQPLTLTWVTPDGQPMEVPAQDVRQDLVADMAEVDADGDGEPDAWLYDPAGTGQADLMVTDADGDGQPDTLSVDVDGGGNWVPVDGPGAGGPASGTFDAASAVTRAADAAEQQGDPALAERLRGSYDFFLAEPLAQPWLLEADAGAGGAATTPDADADAAPPPEPGGSASPAG